MHSLSLASPSPPGDLLEARGEQTDVDMGEGEISTPAPSLPNQAKDSTNFIPRQLKYTSLLRSGMASTVPLHPSPLFHSERFQSSSTGSTPSGSAIPISSPSQPQSTASAEDPRKTTTSMHSDNQSSSCNSPASSQTPAFNRTKSQYNIKIRDSPLQITRTPSPSPLPSSPCSEEEERKLHYSPGLSQTTFPGGKHMLRYTMGYREDCVSCQSKSEFCSIQPRLKDS